MDDTIDLITMAQQQAKKDHFTQFFVEMEHKWLNHWKNEGIVNKYLHKNDGSSERFSFQDGPITANNPMGVHHAWGRTYKDLWQRFYNLLGARQRFQSGFDCQGLWVEVEVEKELKLRSKKDIENLVPGDSFKSIAKFIQLCKDRVHKYADIQTDQSKRLGYFMDWENSYYTMSEENNYLIWHFLKVCHENDWIYKGHESVPWCPRCETAISQHEMLTEDYKEVVHESIFFQLPIVGRENEYLLVWTTTPWTLPANIAVAVDKDIEYALVGGETGNTFWVAKDLVQSVFKEKHHEIIKTVKGSELTGLKYTGPFDQLQAVKDVAVKYPDVFHTVVETDSQIMPITTEEGTGLVHTAVSAGTEDFRLGKKLGLPMIPVIADNADYLPHMGFLAGKNAKKHPELIFDHLKERDAAGENWIFEIRRYKHRYPGCWRCKTELVWKVADEWYIAMDRPSKDARKGTLRERMMNVTKHIKWIPAFGLDRELDWLKNMHDWLISKKNRYWGLALPIYECPECNSFEVIGSKEELQERSVDGWDRFKGHTPHKPYIDEVTISCSKCGKQIHRIGDVGNPWLDAGIVPYSTMRENNQGEPLYTKDKAEWKKWFPADFITESFPGQFKNWFYAMIAMSSALENTKPFKQVLGFATLVGEDGRPMHKSWGNSIEFNEGADEIGVDVMRWMYVRQNPAENLAFGPKKAQEVRRQFYLPLWNIFKFYRMNAEVDGIEFSDDSFENVKLSVLDQWIRSRLRQTESVVKSRLSAYEPKQAAVSIEEMVQDLSLWYIRRSRDRVGPSATDKDDQQSFYTTSQYIFKNLAIIISPFLPFISEEIYTILTGGESVHLESWPELDENIDKRLIDDMNIVRQIVEVGHRIRKENQIKVRQPLASLTAQLPKSFKLHHVNFLEEYKELVAAELNVKKVILEESSGEEINVSYDLHISKELQLEGEMRDLVRKIQNQRKKLGIKISDAISITIEEKFKPFEESIASQVQSTDISYGPELQVEKRA